MTRAAQFKTPVQFLRLFLHELSRVYGDRMLSVEDSQTFKQTVTDAAKRLLMDCEGIDPQEVLAEPNICCWFGQGFSGDKAYDLIPSFSKLKQVHIKLHDGLFTRIVAG